MNSYQKLRHTLKTGDLVAFSGKTLVSTAIKFKTDSSISHVGMVYKNEDGRVQVIESSALSTQKDLISNTYRKGVQIHYLSERLAKFDGTVYLQRIVIKIPHKEEMLEWLSTKHSKATKYDLLQALGAGMDIFDALGLRNEPDFSRLFCSEMVARALQVGGVLSKAINASEEVPADVCSYNCFGSKFFLKV